MDQSNTTFCGPIKHYILWTNQTFHSLDQSKNPLLRPIKHYTLWTNKTIHSVEQSNITSHSGDQSNTTLCGSIKQSTLWINQTIHSFDQSKTSQLSEPLSGIAKTTLFEPIQHCNLWSAENAPLRRLTFFQNHLLSIQVKKFSAIAYKYSIGY